MSFNPLTNQYRQVIPRWHTYPMARWLGVTVSSTYDLAEAKEVGVNENYNERIFAWESHGKLSHASDLVGNALVLNRFDDEKAIQAARFILESKNKPPKLLIDVAESFLRIATREPLPIPDVIIPEEAKSYFGAISSIKARTREYPRNPVLWMDLAYYYSAIGVTDAADKAVRIALSLNCENRYLLRSGARYFIHRGEPDTALHYLRRSSTGQYDPWLIAAEVAISDTVDSPSQRIKMAKGLIASQSIPKFHLSELASALGTIQLKSGAKKKGRKLFDLALEQPTENALAQAAFMQNMLGEHKEKIRPERLPQSFEAQSRLSFRNGDFRVALREAINWLAYQPFSTAPATFGSYIAGVALCQFEESIKIAKMGLMSHPRDFMLTNNRAFGLASLDKIGEAQVLLDSIVDAGLSEPNKAVLHATRGLIEFRKGNILEGRKLYSIAVESFKHLKDTRSEALALYFWAREEKSSKSVLANRLSEDALEKAKSLNIKELLIEPPSGQFHIM